MGKVPKKWSAQKGWYLSQNFSKPFIWWFEKTYKQQNITKILFFNRFFMLDMQKGPDLGQMLTQIPFLVPFLCKKGGFLRILGPILGLYEQICNLH